MKYMGSKNRVAKEILPIMLKNRIPNQYFVEPFVGGSNVIDKVEGNRLASDNNKYLIELYHKLQNGYKPIDFISREDYYDIKLNKEKHPMEVVALCGILASYNGNWFRAYGGYSDGSREYKINLVGTEFEHVAKATVIHDMHLEDIELFQTLVMPLDELETLELIEFTKNSALDSKNEILEAFISENTKPSTLPIQDLTTIYDETEFNRRNNYKPCNQ